MFLLFVISGIRIFEDVSDHKVSESILIQFTSLGRGGLGQY